MIFFVGSDVNCCSQHQVQALSQPTLNSCKFIYLILQVFCCCLYTQTLDPAFRNMFCMALSCITEGLCLFKQLAGSSSCYSQLLSEEPLCKSVIYFCVFELAHEEQCNRKHLRNLHIRFKIISLNVLVIIKNFQDVSCGLLSFWTNGKILC